MTDPRKKYLIYPAFQVPLIIGGFLGVSVCAALLISLINSSLVEFMTLGTNAGFPPDHPYFQLLTAQQKIVFWKLTIGVVISLLFNGLFFLWLSYRLVAPISKLKDYLTQYCEENPKGIATPPLMFRRHDFGVDLVRLINKALDSTTQYEGARPSVEVDGVSAAPPAEDNE